MIFPYNVDVPMPRWPIANWALIAATSAVFLIFGVSKDDALLALWRGDDFRWWQPLTYTLLHADIIHLAGNMLFLFVFGNAVNARFGHALYLALYALLSVVSGLAWLLIDADGVVLLGASGAIMGVVGAFLVYYPRNDISVFYWLGMIWTGTFQVSSYVMILIYVAWDLVSYFLMRGMDGVAYISHLIGAGAGVALAALVLQIGLVKPGAGEETLFSKRDRRPPSRRAGPPPGAALRPPPRPRARVDDDAPIPLADEPPRTKRP
jgi:membrane associated rhomboid family serine protease